ncbi:hypothetical protein AKJ16_DCAP03461 [Drosera capensis]
MPGTIQVSVMELIGLPSESASSSIVIKVSLGKQVIETSVENGDLSFPLTTLRDNLVVKIHDNEGNELAHTGFTLSIVLFHFTWMIVDVASCCAKRFVYEAFRNALDLDLFWSEGVQTRLIVEKGTWDDMFPLEGGGQVHMRLIFLLNVEERQRIRKMRESASKKKKEEYPKKELEHSELSLPSDDSTLHADHRADVAHGGSSSELVSIPSLDKTHQVDPSHTDVKEETFKKEPSTISDSADSVDSVDELVISSQVSQKFEQFDVSEESSLEKDSTNIRKMIVAFESSLSKNTLQLEMESVKDSSITGTISEKSKIQPVYVELENTEEIHTRAEPEPDPPSTATRAVEVVEELKSNLQSVCTELKNTEEIQTHVVQEPDPSITAMFTEEDILTHEATAQESSSNATEEFTCQSHDQGYNKDEKPRTIDVGDEHYLEQRSLGESVKSSSSETNEFLGPLDNLVSGETQSLDLLAKEDTCTDICAIGSNNHQLAHDVANSFEVPHEAECITTSGFVEEIPIEAGVFPDAGSASTLAIGQTPISELSSEEHQQIFSVSTPEEDIPSRVKTPEPVGDSKGPVGQAIKIAVIIGFGLFIILSTQRRSR